MSPEELSEVVGQVLLAGIDRDILSGWGGIVYVLTEDGITVKMLKTKQS